jgi:hypothetical protein
MSIRSSRPGRATEVPLRDATSRGTLGRAMQPFGGRRSGMRVLCVLVVVATLVTAAPADAFPVATVRQARCSGPSRWKLAVVRDGGSLRVRLAVRGGRPGQRWNVFMDHNRTGFFAGHRISGTDGFWVVRRRVPNRAGTDVIRFGAHNVATGETCRGRASA